jgi:hypothetical protein
VNRCKKCGSPYYGKRHRCAGTVDSKFKTRKQLGLKDGELPFKFRVEIDPKEDGEVEVSRKRALLRLNSQRIYAQMGCSVQALNSMKNTALWMARLAENMDEEDKSTVLPILVATEGMLSGLEDLSHRMTGRAMQMEEVVEKERKHARAARQRLVKASNDKFRKTNEFGIFRLGTDGIDLLPMEEEDILKQFDFMIKAGKGLPGDDG